MYRQRHCGAGTKSRFHPYFETMPEVPPCGWLMPPEQALKALHAYPIADIDKPVWVNVLGQARDMYEEVSSASFLAEIPLRSPR